jgi:hypothetical protein
VRVVFDFNLLAIYTLAIYKQYMLKKYFDIIKKYVYNIKIDNKQEDW